MTNLHYEDGEGRIDGTEMQGNVLWSEGAMQRFTIKYTLVGQAERQVLLDRVVVIPMPYKDR